MPKSFVLRTILEDKKNGFHVGIVEGSSCVLIPGGPKKTQHNFKSISLTFHTLGCAHIIPMSCTGIFLTIHANFVSITHVRCRNQVNPCSTQILICAKIDVTAQLDWVFFTWNREYSEDFEGSSRSLLELIPF